MNPEAPCYYRQDGFPELPVRFARGAGHLLHDDAGRAYTDLCAGFGAVSCGHANVTVNARLQRQLETLSAAAYSRTAIADECVAALDARLPEGLHTAALYSTGAEAIEQALRLARAMTGRRRFISFQGHFHGKTHGNMFLLQQYPGVYGPRPEGYATTLDFGAPGQDAFSASALEEALAQAAGDDLAGVVFEATIGYSGPYALPGEFAPALRRFCDRHGAVLIADEIFSGLLRCGEWFLSARSGCCPDILCFGKGLGNGFPISAVATSPSGAGSLRHATPGSTFAGNVLACAAALGVFEVLGGLPELPGEIAAHERAFFDKVHAVFPGGARGVTPGGQGLLLGVRLGGCSPDEIMGHFHAVLSAGVLVSYNPRGLRLSPPLTIPAAAFNDGVDTLLRVLDARL